MTSGSDIKAGGVHFEISANARKLRDGVREADKELTQVAQKIKTKLGSAVGAGAGVDSVDREIQNLASRISSRLGPKFGGDFARAITQGLIAAFGGIAIDAALREVLESVRKARDTGEMDGYALGASIMTGVRKGLEAVPVSGALGSILAEAFDSVMGSPIADERVRAEFVARAKEVARAYEGIGALTRGAERQGLDPIARQIAEAEESLRPFISRLLELGQAGTAIDDAAEAFRRLRRDAAIGAADKTFADALRTVDRLTGASSAQDEQLRQVRELQSRVRQALESAGLGAEARDAGDLVGRRFGEGIAESLERELRDVGKTELDRLADRLRFAEVDPELVERALQARAGLMRAAIAQDPAKVYGTFSTFLASRLDQRVANEPTRKIEDRIGRIDANLERLLREIRDPQRGISFGA